MYGGHTFTFKRLFERVFFFRELSNDFSARYFDVLFEPSTAFVSDKNSRIVGNETNLSQKAQKGHILLSIDIEQKKVALKRKETDMLQDQNYFTKEWGTSCGCGVIPTRSLSQEKTFRCTCKKVTCDFGRNQI